MSTTITLKENECALVLSEEGCEAYIPDPKEENTKATNTEVLTAALALAIKNQDAHIQAIIGKFIKDYEEYIAK